MVVSSSHHSSRLPPGMSASASASANQKLDASYQYKELGDSNAVVPAQRQTPLEAPEDLSASLVLLTTNNILFMGARAHISLCPPGKGRAELQARLRHRPRRPLELPKELQHWLGSQGSEYYHQQQDNEFLNKTDAFKYEFDSDEEASSGDEDAILSLDQMFSGARVHLDDVDSYHNLREPLFTPTGGDSTGTTGKLPFNRRKLRMFDWVTPEDRIIARKYIKQEFRNAKRRHGIRLTRQLHKKQLQDELQKMIKLGQDTVQIQAELSRQDDALDNNMSPLSHPMNPSLASAMLMESLLVNPVESVEGIGKCYDGLVSAGLALLEIQSEDHMDMSNSRSQVMRSLAPLLITSLSKTAGDAILALARLRRQCATPRYQRRFVQRIAPALIRPPQGAIWCLKQQQDMEAILSASELLFDAAFEMFKPGWYERGQALLRDSARAETLHSAAAQLRSLSQEASSNSISIGRRRGKSFGGHESLSEWELVAVDDEIRFTIQGLLRADWCLPDASRHGLPRPQRRGVSMDSPRSMPSPRTPQRKFTAMPKNHAKSPPHGGIGLPNMNTSEIYESNMSLSVASHGTMDRPLSPPPSTPPLRRTGSQETEVSGFSTSTPPKSPKSPTHHTIDQPLLSPSRAQPFYAMPTPHSPSTSSIGTAGSGDMVSYKLGAGQSLSPSSSAPIMSYRTLTSTVSERKRTVAACRALRAQIQRFEEAFMQMHGRPPKGAMDRAPLASTYAQYREWKRAIRADAACRIQAFFRGSIARANMLRSIDRRLVRVVMKRPGRHSSSLAQPDLHITGNSSGLPEMPSSLRGSFADWPGKHVRPRSSPSEMIGSASRGSTSPVMNSPNRTSSPDIEQMSLPELLARKRDLKQQLKQYDMNFARKHGRMPVKAEKEPIRHLYEAYNALKGHITTMEHETRQARSQTPPRPGVQRSVSPSSVSGSDSGNENTSPARINSGVPRSKHKVPRSSSPPMLPVSSPPPAHDLASLKEEKGRLHQMLRNYEKDFFKEHNRQVSSFDDIKPVAGQYRRYKEIKKAIAALQQH